MEIVRLSGRMILVEDRATLRSIKFSSSLTFPGKLYLFKKSMA